MEENEFRDALRNVLTQSHEPPPMESATAIAAGKRADRRRTALACTGAVVALAAVTVIPARYLSSGPAAGGIPAAAASAPALTPRPSSPDGPADPSHTKPSWPAEASGDATADSGPHYQNGQKLFAELLKVVPDGYTTPTGTWPDGTQRQWAQSSIEDPEWSYLAQAVVARDGGSGQLLVEVHESDNTLPHDPCKLATSFWSIGGACTVERVGSAKVGVVTPTGKDRRVDQWAAYRYADGVVVFVGQSLHGSFAPEQSGKPLAQLPFDRRALAGLATEARFHIGG
jgi:hypothetical protein